MTQSNYFHFCIRNRGNAHPKTLFEYEVETGLVVVFGEPKSKLYSKEFRPIEILFDMSYFSEDMIEEVRKKYFFRYVHKSMQNKKIPNIHRVCGAPDRLIHEGYIVISLFNPAEEDRNRLNVNDFLKLNKLS
jgi:hypothetical protein